LISKRKELLRNIQTLDDYLRERGGANVDFARELIQRRVCFAVVTLRGKTFFAPSRFVGYVGDDRQAHLANDDKDGRETKPVISQILGNLPTGSDEMDCTDRDKERHVVAKGLALAKTIPRPTTGDAGVPSTNPQSGPVTDDAGTFYQVFIKNPHRKARSARSDRALETELKELKEKGLESWLGGRDLNPDNVVQRAVNVLRCAPVRSVFLGFSQSPLRSALVSFPVFTHKMSHCVSDAPDHLPLET
jgi:hypothetical protein